MRKFKANTARRLASNGYIHSNRDLFVGYGNLVYQSLAKSLKPRSKKSNLQIKLKNLIDITQRKEEDFLLNEFDCKSPMEFEQKYMNISESQNDDDYIKIVKAIKDIVSSRAFVDTILRDYELTDKGRKELANFLASDTNKYKEIDVNKTNDEFLNEFVNKINGSVKRATKNMGKEKEELRNNSVTFEKMKDDDFMKAFVTHLQENTKETYSRKDVQEAILKILSPKLEKNDYLNTYDAVKNGVQLIKVQLEARGIPVAGNERFVEDIVKLILREITVNGQVKPELKTRSKLSGENLEVTMELLFNFEFLNRGGASIKQIVETLQTKSGMPWHKIGDTMAKRTTGGNSYHPSDLKFVSNKGTVYYFQLKNSLNDFVSGKGVDQKRYGIMNVQGEITLGKLMDNLNQLGYITDNKAPQYFKYLMGNIGFLNRNENRTTNKKAKHNNGAGYDDLKNQVMEILMTMINYFTVTFQENEERGFLEGEVEKSFNKSNGNLFFIYRGKYLIPISRILRAAYSFFDEGEKELSGSFTLNPFAIAQKQIVNSLGISNADDFYESKLKVIRGFESGKVKGREYPSELVAVGARLGSDKGSLDSTKINGLRLSFDLDRLGKQLNNMI